MWLEVEDLLKKWWEVAHVEGYASFMVAKKLKLAKVDIKKWNKEVLGILRFEIQPHGFY